MFDKKNDDVKKPRLKARYNREDLIELLADLKVDNKYDKSKREFSLISLDDETAPGLRQLFDMAGLEIESPGHWQTVLISLSNAIFPEGDGRRIKWRVWREEFMNRLCELARANPDKNQTELCQSFKDERPVGEQVPAVESLRQQLQKFLRECRGLAEENQASEKELEWLRYIPTRET